MVIAAMDIDLRKIYCVTETGNIIAKANPCAEEVRRGLDELYIKSPDPNDVLLIEVASPVMYMSDASANHNVLRWALWNISTATTLARISHAIGVHVLVAPSHVWTCGHALKLRHEIAGCTQKQKDLRECEAMIYYYKQSPEKWVPLEQYLEEL